MPIGPIQLTTLSYATTGDNIVIIVVTINKIIILIINLVIWNGIGYVVVDVGYIVDYIDIVG